jgi:ATP-binding cassette subfamily F protein 3
MSLVTANEVTVAFGPRSILDAVSFAVQPGDRIGLVGPNGSGKTTLLRLLAGEREADDGELRFARGVRAGYLPQDIQELPPGTLVESVRASVGGQDRILAALAAADEELAAATAAGLAADDEETLELAQRIADLHGELDAFEERFGRHRAEEILAGLGFPEWRFDRPIDELSGGWKMRAALAGLLLLAPDLLLLDEPTNHLDVPSLAWFDDFLRRSRKALVLVSHDREFLNRQIARVLTFEPEGLRAYPGDYDSYRRQRAEEEENLELRARRQAAQRAETLRFIERFRYKATKARQVQSRVKLLAKEETIQTREARAQVRFRFPTVARSGRDVVVLDRVRKAYGDNVLYRGLTRTVHRGERIAIIGVNGAGKTTLLKMLAGEVEADGGTIGFGANVALAYYAQHHTELLARERTIIDEIWSLVPREPQTFVRSVLGSFLFSGDDVDKKIGVLSGGEKARVALARLLVVPSNLMLMDEPTNHLDLASSETLARALADYDGTLIFVSHNRSFINQLATQIWDVRDGDVTEWTGNLDAYLYHLEQIGQPMGGVHPPDAAAPAPAESERARRQREAREREVRLARVRPLRAEVAALEERIAALEAERRALEPELADPGLYQDFARARPLLERAAAVKEELDGLYARWEAAQERLEEAQREG